MNLQLDIILTRVDDITSGQADIPKLVAEGKLIIKKRRKLIRIAVKNRGGWYVFQEYDSDDFASEDEKKIRKAKATAEKKRSVTAVTLPVKFKSSSDFQHFRGKTTVKFLLCVKFSVLWLVCLSIQPSSCCI